LTAVRVAGRPPKGYFTPMKSVRPSSADRRSHGCRPAFRCLRVVGVLILVVGIGPTGAADPHRLQFTRLVAHWSDYANPDYLKFIKDARPEVAQVGFYGGHFWSLGHTPQFNGYPAHFPVRGLAELGDWFQDLNGKLHARGVKVVGHFNVEFLVGDPNGPAGPTGFFKFYRDLWDESVLGPRPAADPVSLLEKNADGTPIKTRTYAIGGMNEHWACLRNPAWRAVLKAWARHPFFRSANGLWLVETVPAEYLTQT
jgi:hypothetical protein